MEKTNILGCQYFTTFPSISARTYTFVQLYSMDRSITVPAVRPLEIADEHIDVQLPNLQSQWLLDTRGIESPAAQLDSIRRRRQWINHVRIRQLESEIYSINFCDKEPPLHFVTWMKDMDTRLQSWRLDVISLSDSGPDWFDFVTSTVRFYLHMPCPRNPSPTDESLLACFDDAIIFGSGYSSMLQHGFLKFDWHCAHQCFTAGMLVLRFTALYLRRHSHARFIEVVDLFSDVFVSNVALNAF